MTLPLEETYGYIPNAEAKGASPPQWIPVTERLPKEGEAFGVVRRDGNGHYFFSSYYTEVSDYVQHPTDLWYPMPRLPEEVKEDATALAQDIYNYIVKQPPGLVQATVHKVSQMLKGIK